MIQETMIQETTIQETMIQELARVHTLSVLPARLHYELTPWPWCCSPQAAVTFAGAGQVGNGRVEADGQAAGYALGVRLSRSSSFAVFTSPATDATFIFLITFARCDLIERSHRPISRASCLLRLPWTTPM